MERQITEIKNEALGEKYYSVKHPSGLTILIYPKEGYSSSFAMFGTDYGSIDTKYKRSDSDELEVIPEGCAHFLEHKLFESEDLDAFERFAKTGASANAYTSFDKTCYLFSCSDRFDESLEILLDFVQSPYFTEKTVQKEQGIIGQEIKMYQDVPDWQVLFNLLGIMYSKHPVRVDIAGTTESIATITAQTLYDCYNTFYNLNNMVLAVVGNVSVEEVLEIADRQLKKSDNVTVSRVPFDEPDETVSAYTEQKLPVTVPSFILGYKESCKNCQTRTLKERIETAVLLDIIAGDSSQLYKELIDSSLANSGFSKEYFTGFGYAATMFSGESKDPEKAAEMIKAKIREIKRNGIADADFDRVRKSHYGCAIKDYNDIDNLANELVAAYFQGEELFSELEIYKNLKKSDIEKRLSEEFDEQYSALSVILPV